MQSARASRVTLDGQYSVTVSAANGPAVAIVLELATGGDAFMIYEGFAAPGP